MVSTWTCWPSAVTSMEPADPEAVAVIGAAWAGSGAETMPAHGSAIVHSATVMIFLPFGIPDLLQSWVPPFGHRQAAARP
jgi:hypothetical protein